MKTLPLALGAVLCLLLSSCVTDSLEPLSSPDTAQADPRLIGDWRVEGDADSGTFHFSISNGAWIHVDLIPDKPDDKKEAYDLFPTVIGDNHFLNVVQVGKDDQGHPAKRYIFLRYTISSDHVLQMWMMSQDVAAQAVRTGKLKGLVKTNGLTLAQPTRPDMDVTLQASSADLLKFIEGNNATSLFNEKMEPLYRLKPPS